MHKKLLEDLAITDGIYDCLCDPYDKFKTGDYYGSVMWDLERFAEKIVRECTIALWTEECRTSDLALEEYQKNGKKILKHFGIEE